MIQMKQLRYFLVLLLLQLVLSVRPESSLPQQISEAKPKSSTPIEALPKDLLPWESGALPVLESFPRESREAQQRQIQEAAERQRPLEVQTRKLGMRFRYVPSGTGWLGSPEKEARRSRLEALPHAVTFAKGMYVSTFEVTQAEWEKLMGENPSDQQQSGKQAPVEMLSYVECEQFLRKLCALEGVPEGTYRLLTESEWEYACRAGSGDPVAFGKSLSSTQANFDGRYPYGAAEASDFIRKTIAVGSYPPNAFGLYDMHGNVWEWTSTRKSEGTTSSSSDDSRKQVIKGGSYQSVGKACRSATRAYQNPERKSWSIGFRVLRVLP